MATLVDRQSAQVISSITDFSQLDPRPDYAFFGAVTSSKGEVNKPYIIYTTTALESYFGSSLVVDDDGDTLVRFPGLAAAYKIIESGYPGYLIRIAHYEGDGDPNTDDDDPNFAFAKISSLPTNPSGNGTYEFKTNAKGSWGNAYSLKILPYDSASGTQEIRLMLGELIVEKHVVNFGTPSGTSYSILKIGDNSEYLQSPTYTAASSSDEDLYPLEANTSVAFAGGTDGLEGLEAEDYIGVRDDENGNNTGAYVFLRNDIRAQFWPALAPDLQEDESVHELKQYYAAMRTIASERKDVTCIYDPPNNWTRTNICKWIVPDEVEEGDILLEGFNCEIYWDWTKDTHQGYVFDCPPSPYVVSNSLKSWQLNGPWFPVAGSNRGRIAPYEVKTQIPSVTARDKLITYHINPIWDSGLNGVMIWGNETLNREYSDLSAAHIGRTLTYIRSTIDQMTESMLFELNDSTLWNTWTTRVNTFLGSIKANRGLQWFRTKMGLDTTSRAEISQRKIRGRIELQFTPDAEIFILSYHVYASSLTEKEIIEKYGS